MIKNDDVLGLPKDLVSIDAVQNDIGRILDAFDGPGKHSTMVVCAATIIVAASMATASNATEEDFIKVARAAFKQHKDYIGYEHGASPRYLM